MKAAVLLKITQLFDEQSSEEQHLFEIEIFCSIKNVFTVTFDQFSACLLNKKVLISI